MQQYLERVKQILSERTSESKAILQEDFARELGCSTRTLRLIVNEIRSTNAFGNAFLVSSHNAGYWLSDDKEDLRQWVKSYKNQSLNMLKTLKQAAKLLSHKDKLDLKFQFEFSNEDLGIIEAGETVENKYLAPRNNPKPSFVQPEINY